MTETTSLVGKFTTENSIRSLKGAAISAGGVFAVAILQAVGAMEFTSPIVAVIAGAVCASLINAIKELLSNR